MLERPVCSKQFQSTPPARGATFGLLRKTVPILGFQSTPPARGATDLRAAARRPAGISIHAPREGGDCTAVVVMDVVSISIHAPREGGDATSRP